MDIAAQVDAFFAGRMHAWALFGALHRAVADRWPDTQLRVMKTCISFDDPKPYLYVSFPKKKSMGGILLSISLREKKEHPRFLMVVPVSAGRYTVHIHIEEKEQIDEELLAWIAQSRR